MRVKINVPTEISLKPKDAVYLIEERKNTWIKRIVETSHGVYVVLYNDTWRPLTTYGRTWKKI